MIRAIACCLPLVLMACIPSPISIGENNPGGEKADLTGGSIEADAAPPPDIATVDGAPADLAMPLVDAAMPDVAVPDLTMPDLAMPDLAISDLATPDLSDPRDQASPDLSTPDLATPDLLGPDLARPPDLVAPGDLAAQLAVTPGVGPITWPLLLPQSPIGDQTAYDPQGFGVGDINKDGRLDIVAITGAHQLPERMSVSLADGPQSFSVTRFTDLSWTWANNNVNALRRCCLISDVNNDGKMDVTFSFGGNGGIQSNTLLGNGDGTFQKSWAPVPGENNVPTADQLVTAGDFDGDGNADKAEVQQGGLFIWMSDGKGGFQSITSFPFGPWGWLRATDLNGDRIDDLVVQVAATTSYTIGVIYGRRAGSLLPPTSLDSQSFGVPSQVAGGDFDRDGKDDLVSLGDKSTLLSLFLSKGDGTFAPESLVVAGTAPRSLAVADFNGDGKLDLVTANTSSKDLTVLLGKGDGTFQPPIATPAAAAPISVVAGDLDGNGKADVVAMTAADLLFFSGKGDGTFQAAQVTAGFAAQTRLLSGDVNGDGRVDLLAAPLQFIPFKALNGGVYLGNGNGTFKPAVPATFDSASSLGDLDRDGADDLVNCEYQSPYGKGDSVDVLLSKRDGTFQNAVRYEAEYSTDGSTVVDVNRDGKLDVVATGAFNRGTIKVFLGNGDGTLQPLRLFGRVTGGLGPLVSADVDGDSHPDIAALFPVNGGLSGIRVFRNARHW